MKLTLDRGAVCSSNVVHQQNFKISDSAHLADILSNKIYSDGIKACITELCCNAADSHVEAGTTRPFEIHLPNRDNREFKLRDFGTGLSREDVLNLYTCYGLSTKNEGNRSNEYTGAFGIGKGAFYTCTSQCTVTSYFHGRKHIFVMAKNEEGQQTVNQMSPDEGFESDEPNGLEISFVYDRPNYHEFSYKAKEVFQYFGDYIPLRTDKGDAFKPIEWKGDFSDDTFCYTAHSYGGKCIALMGRVAYPIDLDQVDHERWNKINKGCPYVMINFEIGELEVNAGRESLRYNKNTIANIQKKFDHIIQTIGEEIKNKAQNITSALDWIKFKNSYSKEYEGFVEDLIDDKISPSFSKELENLGRSYHKEVYPVRPAGDTVKADTRSENHYYQRDREGGVLRLFAQKISKLKDGQNLVIIHRDEKQWALKVQSNYNVGGTDIVYITENLQAATELTTLLGIDLVKLSTLKIDKSKVGSLTTGGSKSSNVKIGKAFLWDGAGKQVMSSSWNSRYWSPTTVSLDAGGYYLEINNYSIEKQHSSDHFKRLIYLYEELSGNTFTDKIYGFKTANIDKIKAKPNWINAYQFIMEKSRELAIKKGYPYALKVKGNYSQRRPYHKLNELKRASKNLPDDHLIVKTREELIKLERHLEYTMNKQLPDNIYMLQLDHSKEVVDWGEDLLAEVYKEYPFLDETCEAVDLVKMWDERTATLAAV